MTAQPPRPRRGLRELLPLCLPTVTRGETGTAHTAGDRTDLVCRARDGRVTGLVKRKVVLAPTALPLQPRRVAVPRTAQDMAPTTVAPPERKSVALRMVAGTTGLAGRTRTAGIQVVGAMAIPAGTIAGTDPQATTGVHRAKTIKIARASTEIQRRRRCSDTSAELTFGKQRHAWNPNAGDQSFSAGSKT